MRNNSKFGEWEKDGGIKDVFGISPNMELQYNRTLTPVVIGELLNDSFNRASLGSNYTLVSTDSTATIVSNKLEFFRPTAGSWTNYLYYNAYSSTLNNFQSTVTYTLPTLSALTNGLMIGVRGVNGSVFRNIVAFFNTKSTSGNVGTISVYDSNNGSNDLKVLGVSVLTMASGDNITVDCVMNDLSFDITVTNNTNPNSITQNYTFGLTSPELIQTVWNPVIYNIAGNFTIDSWVVQSDDFKNVTVGVVGDSTSYGVGATTLANTWKGLIESNQSATKTITSLALGSTITDDLIEANSELLVVNPTYYVLMIGSNDINRNIGGDGEANAKTNIATLITSLETKGTVIIMTPLARNADDMTSYSSWLISTYGSSNKVIDLFTFTKDGATTNLNPLWTADGTHLNDTGQAAVYAEIVSEAPELL